jgi:hypothetical protein
MPTSPIAASTSPIPASTSPIPASDFADSSVDLAHSSVDLSLFDVESRQSNADVPLLDARLRQSSVDLGQIEADLWQSGVHPPLVIAGLESNGTDRHRVDAQARLIGLRHAEVRRMDRPRAPFASFRHCLAPTRAARDPLPRLRSFGDRVGAAVRRLRDVTGVLLLAGASGCIPAPSYQGTGALQPSGEYPIIAPAAVRWSVCDRPLRASNEPAFEPSSRVPAPPPLTAFSIGPKCVVAGTGHSSDFQAFAGQECTLTFPEGSRRLRVEGFSVDAGPRGAINEAIAIDLRGIDVATGHYALYHFEGGGDSPGPAPDDPCPAVTAAHLGPALAARP